MTLRIVRAAALASASLALASTVAAAADIETVVVTGSYVTGAAEQTALPVTVLTADDIKKRGSPSMVDLIKALPSSSAVFGDANQFTAGRTEGVSSVNLRGLSASRTLVLFNGRRITQSAASALTPLVDLNMFPTAAIGRIEVLKDGAAATYGSEAIGGVVNIITKEHFDGLELSGDYRAIMGSNGDYNAGAAWGWGDDHVNVFLAAGYNHQSTLRATERDFATPKYTTQAGALAALFQNPGGGWSGAGMNYIAAASPISATQSNVVNPGFSNPTPPGGIPTNFPIGAIVQDPACSTDWSGEANTNVANNIVSSGLANTANRCYWRFADFDNLEEDNDRFQGYGEVNVDLPHEIKLHIEGLYGQTNVHNVPQSSSYLPNQFPGAAGPSKTIGVGPAAGGFANANFYIPVTNPGLATLRALNPGTQLTLNSNQGLYAGSLIWRALTVGGNPAFKGLGQLGQREQDTYRVSASLSGGLPFLGDTQWNIAATQSESNATQITPDMLVDRLQLGLRGLASRDGSAPCDPATGIPGTGTVVAGGCFYVNPFSTGIEKQAITGAVNPQFAAAFAMDNRVVNDGKVLSWVYGPDSQLTFASNQELVLDAVLNGTLPVKLWSTNIGWAAGLQYRKDTYTGRSGAFTDNSITPCIDTILTGTTSCAVKNGPYGFYGNYQPYHLSGETKAAFAELDIPITDDIQTQIAARYEAIYGGKTTFNPKASIRWQATDWLGFRASAGSTFRAPPLGSLVPNAVTILAFSPAAGGYTPFDTFGNGGKPLGTVGLSPEKAKTINVGLLLDFEGLTGTLDWWHFDFANPLSTESGNAIIGAIFPNAPGTPAHPFGSGNNCATAGYSHLLDRITFTAVGPDQQTKCQLTTAGSGIARVHVNTINGSGVQTQGLDLGLQYLRPDVFDDGDALTFRVDGTYTLNYLVSAQVVEGVTIIPKFDGAGELNVGNGSVVSLPHTKGSFFTQYNDGPHNLRLTMNYVGSMRDSNSPIASRASIFVNPQAGFTVPSTAGATVAPWITFDLAYQFAWIDENLLFNFTMNNVFDKDPPFARTDYSYDAFTANPYGRTFKFGVTANL